ncbi:MAG: energy transducer TonB [Aquincola sp.]|nr:energy transducer TonB [Aquincola sp.]
MRWLWPARSPPRRLSPSFSRRRRPPSRRPCRQSAAATSQAYKKDGAKHLYAAYAKQIHKGKLAPLLYGVAIIETTIGPQGEVQDVRVVRQPAAAEVTPWAVDMIKAAAPFPAPQKMGSVTYTDIWLVNKQGRFQLDTLTEGQR